MNTLRSSFRGWRALVISALMLLGGCTAETVKEEVVLKGDYVWPTPPDAPRYRYVTTIRSSSEIEQTEESKLRERLTGEVVKGISFSEPFGVAARKGLVVVTDTRQRGIHAFDLPNRNHFYFGYRREGKTEKPLGVAIGPDQLIYVVDVSRQVVIVYDNLGLYQRLIGEKSGLDKPTAVAVSGSGERVAVVDTGGIDSERHRVVLFDREGRELMTIGRRGSGEGEFNLPNGVAFGGDGTLYVLDAGNFRVQAFSREGKYLRQWGEVGRRFGQFSRPKGIATDADNNVYVSDASFGNVQVFTDQGALLLPIGRQSDDDYPGRYTLPLGISVDEAGYLYIVDRFFRKLEVIRLLSQGGGPSEPK